MRGWDGALFDRTEFLLPAQHRLNAPWCDCVHLHHCSPATHPSAALDSSDDGIRDAQDADRAAFRVWRDLNQDGVSETDPGHHRRKQNGNSYDSWLHLSQRAGKILIFSPSC